MTDLCLKYRISQQLIDTPCYNMKRINRKKKKVEAYTNGGIFSKQNFKFDTSAIGSAAGGVGQLIGNIGGTSNATTGGEATMQSLAGIASGAGAGAQIGSMFGPAGTIIGGAAGALTGVIGKSGKSAKMTSFTDYDEGSLGTGLIGAFRNKRLRRRRNAIKKNAFNNRAGVAGTEALNEQYAEDDLSNAYSLADGGYAPSLAYVDDGELIQTPSGDISKVPEMGQPTDSNLVELPEGSRILSDKLKVPGTNKTFAQIGEKMMTKRISKNKDKYAENAAKLNEMNNNMIHDQLFEMQEQLKQKRGIKSKSKEIDSFATGGTKKRRGTVAASYMGDTWHPFGYDVFKSAPSTLPTSTVNITNPSTVSRPKKATASTKAATTVEQPVATESYAIDVVDTPRRESMQRVTPTQETNTTESAHVRRRNAREAAEAPKGDRNKFDWLGTATSVASNLGALAPILSNLFSKNEHPTQTNYNPYAGTIRNSMSRRRYNIDPALRDIAANRAITDYNANQMNTNTGANMAYRLQSAVAANNAIANVRAQEGNINNQYLGEYANVLNDLGQQWVNATNRSDEINAQSRATNRNIRRTGMSQLSHLLQNNELMRNQKARDAQMLPLYDRFLSAGFTESDLEDLMSSMGKTRKKSKKG